MAVALAASAACVPPQAAERASDTVTVALRADVTGFYPNPPIVNEAFTLAMNRSVFETLVRFDRHLRLVPLLAERWENPDDRTYVFDIREDARFSDGRPVTARDVAASLDAALRHSWAIADYLRAIESVTVRGERQVAIRTRFNYLPLLARLPWGFVIPAEAVDKQPVPALGSGPYRVEAWDPGRGFSLVRNESYHGPPPGFRRVRFRVVPDDAERVASVERGEADVADNVPFEAIPRLAARDDLRMVVRPSLRVLFLCFRVDAPPFSDPRVREAFDRALDRVELIRRALGGRAQPATQLVPPAIVGFNPDIAATPPDLRLARELLAAAGYSAGLDVTLHGPNNRYVNDGAILAEVGRQLAAAGVRVRVVARDKRDFFARLETERPRFYLLGWSNEAGDAGDLLSSVLHSPSAPTFGGMNYLGLADRELDTLVEAAETAQSDAQRASRLRAALFRTSQLRAALPLLIQTEAVLHTRRIAWDPPVNMVLRAEDLAPAP